MDYQRFACHCTGTGWAGGIAGTLAVVILAKQHGLIESAAQVLHALRSVDFRLDDAIIRETLARTVGEKWKVKR